jgi:hypothetical protein|tara:strand:- start:716 stop:949 length:234 start_codon:yes stop_codon:yes gene_type:complete
MPEKTIVEVRQALIELGQAFIDFDRADHVAIANGRQLRVNVSTLVQSLEESLAIDALPVEEDEPETVFEEQPEDLLV